ncbi:MAG: hypothetical protein J4F28_02040 [Nitrosopumilaceae archaeon]|nr:hypothetical protein [Nitrosopumilaceae archaeon]
MATRFVNSTPMMPRHSIRTDNRDGSILFYMCGDPITFWTSCDKKFPTLDSLVEHNRADHKWEPSACRPCAELGAFSRCADCGRCTHICTHAERLEAAI